MENGTFICKECGNKFLIEEKGEATKNGLPYDVCKECCYDEQNRQFYADM